MSNLPVLSRVAIGGELGRQWKFGFNAAASTTEEAVTDLSAAYTYLAAATQLKISSDDAKDTAAGAGARTVTLTGQDADYNEISETVTLNGQTPVTTINEYLRIYRMQVRTAGSEGDNAGTIYAGTGAVTNGEPANKYAAISEGENQTLMCVYTIPCGKVGLLYSLHASTPKGENVTIRLVAREPGGAFCVKSKFIIYQAPVTLVHQIPLRFDETTDIEVRAKATSAANVAASMELLLVDA